MNGLTARATKEQKVILPIWYEIDKDGIIEYSPPLADRFAIRTEGNNISEVAQEILQVILDEMG